jgi:hypothetical protein
MEFFNFEPDEYQVLEEIEFDETVQRPEKVRFYTLEDQLVDATEKMIPRDRRYTRHDLEQIKQEVTRLEELYNKYVVPRDDTYELREPEYAKRLDWVVRAVEDPTPAGVSIDHIQVMYAAVFRDPRAAGFYPRLLAALPRFRFGEAPGVPHNPDRIETAGLTTARDLQEIRALPLFEMTRTERHSDQSATMTSVPVDGTADTIYTLGYRLKNRGVPIPNPSPDHPFFKVPENNLDVVLDSTAPLEDIVPSLAAIFEHGVPVTQDPYGEGHRFLKVYDVKMENVPWALWKSRFPPVTPITKTPQVDELQFPKPPQNAPGEKILNAYKTPYAPGISARKWLMEQADGGDLVPRALLADAFTNGSVPVVPGLDLGPIRYPDTTLDQCELTGKIFEEFQTAGVLRRKIVQDKVDKERSIVTYTCVPPEFILQERRQLGYAGRLPFKESAPAQILKEHVDALARHRMPEGKDEPEEAEAKTPARPDSVRRTEILGILADERRTPQDKIKDIRELLRETTMEKQVHSDNDGAFVICEHTLAVLNGDLATDRRKFYLDWTAQEDGFRVCKFCGERILRDDAIDQEEYDDAGRLVVKSEAMATPTFQSETLAGYITGINDLKRLFRMDSPIDSVIYTLLTILHVLPGAEQMSAFLKITNWFEFQSKMFNPKEAETEKARLQKGVVGLALAIVLLQTHIPALIPRRAFGSRPLKLDGYPRDTAKSDGYTIVDSMLLVIRVTYDAFPGAVKGPSSALIRGALRDPKRIGMAVREILKVKVLTQDAVQAMMEAARKQYADNPVIQPVPTSLLAPIPPPKELGVIQRFGECRSGRAVLQSPRPPMIEQEVPALRTGILPSRNAKLIEPTRSRRVKTVPMATPDIIARRKIGPGAVKYELGDGWRTNLMLASRLADLFQIELKIRSVDPSQTADELRDIAKGYVYEAFRDIQSTPVKRKRFEELRQTDITLLMLGAQIDLELAAVNRIMAQQRKTFVQRMAEKTDLEREIIDELKRRGMAPIIITTEDRELFAAEIENELRPAAAFAEEEAEVAEGGDYGVGIPQLAEVEEETGGRNIDAGDYGNLAARPDTDGRDPFFTSVLDDRGTSV